TAVDTISEEVVPLQPRRHRKRKPVVVDTGGPSHPPKKLREDYEAPGGPSVSGKSRSAVQRLLVGAVLNVEVRGEPILALPFVTSSVSATPEREGRDHTVFVTEFDLQKVYVPRWSMTNGSRLDDGRVCREMVDEFAPPKFFAS
ncbi:hypothetical protein Tco_0334445, partial [Tanacetum coccineum]